MKTKITFSRNHTGISRFVPVGHTKARLCYWFFACSLLWWTPCRADFATPFVEINNKVGDVSESYGYIVVLGPEMNTRFLVIVTTDAFEHVVLHATAKHGVVKEALLGRWVKLKAVVTKAGGASGKPELEILSRLRTVDPYFRWFSDGFANGAALRVMRKYLSAQAVENFASGYKVAQFADPEKRIHLSWWMGLDYCVEAPLESEKRTRQCPLRLRHT